MLFQLLSTRAVQPLAACLAFVAVLLAGAPGVHYATATTPVLTRVAGAVVPVLTPTDAAPVAAPPASAPGTTAPTATTAAPSRPAKQEAAAPAASPSAARGVLPTGKGMWLWQPEKIEGGNVSALVARAKQLGFTHLYARTGSTWMGFHGAGYLEQLLPKAHAADIRVYGWDFPQLRDPDADVARAVQAITYTTAGGHRLDGFVPDIESSSEGVQLSSLAAHHYGQRLREAVGNDYPLVVAVPRPSGPMVTRYPYGSVVKFFDAIAPMVYWLNRQPDSDVAGALVWLSQFGKPVIPIGQAYDGSPEGGRPGPPHPDEIRRFVATAEQYGAIGVAFWSWQHASPDVMNAIGLAPEFNVPVDEKNLRPGQIRVVQTLMATMGGDVPITGRWDGPMVNALKKYQEAVNLPANGHFGPKLRELLLTPVQPPIRPLPRR